LHYLGQERGVGYDWHVRKGVVVEVILGFFAVVGSVRVVLCEDSELAYGRKNGHTLQSWRSGGGGVIFATRTEHTHTLDVGRNGRILSGRRGTIDWG